MRSILILGATSDIAEAVAGVYASKGYNIVLAGRSAERLQIMKSDIAIRYNAIVNFFLFDADHSHEQHKEFYKSLNHTPDIVLCAFGYLGTQDQAQQNWGEAHAIIQSNYVGAVSILNIIANDMEEKKQGVIAGIS